MWASEPDFTREQLQSIKAPTLIIVGDADIVTPSGLIAVVYRVTCLELESD